MGGADTENFHVMELMNMVQLMKHCCMYIHLVCPVESKPNERNMEHGMEYGSSVLLVRHALFVSVLSVGIHRTAHK